MRRSRFTAAQIIGMIKEQEAALADVLRQRGIPFVFATAYETKVLPARFANVAHYKKPMIVSDCVDRALALAADHSPHRRS